MTAGVPKSWWRRPRVIWPSLAAIAVLIAVSDESGRRFGQTAGKAVAGEAERRDRAAAAAAEADRHRRGFHCLDKSSGAHPGLVEAVVADLRDPASFEHDETRITPVDGAGFHMLFMRYRARNGFGGMNLGTVAARVRSDDCRFAIVASVDG